ATLTDRYFSDPAWIYERKLDGERVIATRRGAHVELHSRTGRVLSNTYPELVDALVAQVTDDFVIDGEVVAFDGRRTSFEKLQQRIGITVREQAAASRVPVFYYVFDLLRLDGDDVTGSPLRDRKELLRTALAFADPLRFTAHRNTNGETYLAQACRWGWEGLIAKRADAPYTHGRSKDWLKFKCVAEQEFVIGGFTDPAGSRVGFGALLVGYYDGADLRYAGKVGTGYDQATLTALRERMDALGRGAQPFAGAPVRERGAHWIRPDLVAQVGFTEWTRDGKLRHPRFLGLRRDKDPHEVVREVPQ
ncbi:MAG TPA: non-homologous end-joining DNA ligase, partial [Micromonosporaceae bacterium]